MVIFCPLREDWDEQKGMVGLEKCVAPRGSCSVAGHGRRLAVFLKRVRRRAGEQLLVRAAREAWDI